MAVGAHRALESRAQREPQSRLDLMSRGAARDDLEGRTAGRAEVRGKRAPLAGRQRVTQWMGEYRRAAGCDDARDALGERRPFGAHMTGSAAFQPAGKGGCEVGCGTELDERPGEVGAGRCLVRSEERQRCVARLPAGNNN